MREKILNALEQNSRIDLHDLSIMIDISEFELANEIASMEKEKIICGYHTLINWDKTTEEKVVALIEVKVTPQRGLGFDKIAERIYNFDEVNALYLMSGAFDFTVLIEASSMKEVSKFVFEKLATLDLVTSTATHFILKKYKDHKIIIDSEKKDNRMMVTL